MKNIISIWSKNAQVYQHYLVVLTVILLILSVSVSAQDSRPETNLESPVALNPSAGQEIGMVYQAFLSPHQEGGEEEDTPRFTPDTFRSTEPSVPRNERDSRGHAVVAFTNDLSRAYVYLAIENVNPEDIVLLHLHCGRPGQLGPIIVDFGLMGDFNQYFSDGVLAMEVTNEDIEAVLDHSEGLIGAFTSGCPIVAALPTDKITTIGGMEYVASQGELYFNLHTAAQTFFGDIRGAFYPIEIGG